MLANSDNDETGAAAPGVACVSPTPRQHSTRCAAPARCRPPRGRGALARVMRAVRAWLAARRLRRTRFGTSSTSSPRLPCRQVLANEQRPVHTSRV